MSNKKFKKLLTEGIYTIAKSQQKSVATIEAEIANLTECSVYTVQYWRRGNIPKDSRHVEILTRFFVTYDRFDRTWCSAFLAEAEYPKAEELLNTFFPTENFPRPQNPLPSEKKSSFQSVGLLNSGSNSQRTTQPFPTLGKDVRQALKEWHGDSNADSPLAYLYLFRQAQREEQITTRQATNRVLLNALEALRATHHDDAQLLRKRFLDLWPIYRLANQAEVAESTFYTLQRQAIKRLTDMIKHLELEARAAQHDFLVARLEPATYVNLIGADKHVAHLQKLLTTPGPPWLLSIEGISGIGKTSLADQLVRQVLTLGLFDEIGWVSARRSKFTPGCVIHAVEKPTLTAEALIEKLLQQLLPDAMLSVGSSVEKMLATLRTRLKATPHLIVIDNLETLTDVESLLPTLQDLANPTKFVLTSRTNFYAEPTIYHFPVPELSERDALQLIRQEAQWSNLPVLAASSDEVLKPIYETVGGNPLALRLVVGQTHVHTLESILYDLRMARGQPVEQLYTFIYWHVWNSLDAVSQQVLLVMPLANPQGAELEYLAEVGDLDIGDLRLAMNKLVTRNLVDARGGLNDRRFSISSLMRTFLQQQVTHWI